MSVLIALVAPRVSTSVRFFTTALAAASCFAPYDNIPDAIEGLKSPNLATQFLARERLLAEGQKSVPALKALLMTYNREKGYGTANRGRYSNAKVDALTEDALQTVDDVKREAYLQRATELAINDTGIVPLHFQVNLWATRDGITYLPRVDESTLAWKFVPDHAPNKTK